MSDDRDKRTMFEGDDFDAAEFIEEFLAELDPDVAHDVVLAKNALDDLGEHSNHAIAIHMASLLADTDHESPSVATVAQAFRGIGVFSIFTVKGPQAALVGLLHALCKMAGMHPGREYLDALAQSVLMSLALTTPSPKSVKLPRIH